MNRIINIHFLKDPKVALGVAGICFFCVVCFVLQGFEGMMAAGLLLAMVSVAYGLIRHLIEDPIDSLCILLAAILGLSFTPPFAQKVLTVLFLVVCSTILLKKKLKGENFFLILPQDWGVLKRSDLLTWIFLFMVMLTLGFYVKGGFLALDPHHPIYELSIGDAYAQSVFSPPDLSYLGKTIKFHFLSTQLPSYFSNLLGVSILTSVYFLVPFFLMICVFITINQFFKKFTSVRIPIFVLFFFPLVSIGFFNIEGLMTRTISTNSFFMAFIVMTIAITYLIEKRFLALFLVSLMLILTKASYFIVLFGGVALFFLRKKDFKNFIIIPGLLLSMFIICYLLFLSGAHKHNHWIVFPTILYERLITDQSITWIAFLIPVMLWISTVSMFLRHDNDEAVLGLSCVSLSAMLGALVLTEVTELNSYQFLTAAYFSTIVVFWFWLGRLSGKKREWEQKTKLLVWGIAVVSFFVCFFNIYREPMKFAAIQVLPERVLKSVVPHSFSQKILNKRKRLEEGEIYLPITSELADAYLWLRENSPVGSLVIFSKHYENKESNKPWWPETGLLRSALSARQMFCEEYKYKGIGMEEEFALRFAATIHFYKHFVNLSSDSQARLNLFYGDQYSFELGYPIALKEKNSWKQRLLNRLIPRQEDLWLKRSQLVMEQIRYYLKTFSADEKLAFNYIQSTGVDYFVLEKGDLPTEKLKEMADVVYRNPSCLVLKVRKR